MRKRTWNRYVTLGGILLAAVACGLGLLLISNLPASVAADNPPQITILPASTYTPTAAEPAADETPEAGGSQTAGGIQTGVYVQISGTNGEGLRIRKSAGLNAGVNFYGMDSEVFLVQDGPVDADGYTWWFIAAPYDDSRSGWAASNFLNVIEQ